MSDKKVPKIKISEEDLISIQSVSSKEYPLKQKPKGDDFIPFIYLWESMHDESESDK